MATEQRYENGVLVETINLPDDPALDNESAIRGQAIAAMRRNRALITDPTVTTAEAVAAVKDHARQLNGIIRLLLNQFDGTD